MADDFQDPASIERDIRRTQEDMSRTVDRIGDQLTPRSVLNAFLDKAEDNKIDARMLLEGTRRNPLALAMIAGGLLWLASDHDADVPKKRGRRRDDDDRRDDRADPQHRDYLAHMGGVEWRDGEDAQNYQRRRDMARASYFMVERDHVEDDQTFRQRLDEAAERFRDRRHAWADQARDAADDLRGRSQEAAGRAQALYTDNPLVGGFLAAAVGALAGASLPSTQMEEEQLGEVGHRARDMIDEQKDHLAAMTREKKDDLVARAEDAARPHAAA